MGGGGVHLMFNIIMFELTDQKFTRIMLMNNKMYLNDVHKEIQYSCRQKLIYSLNILSYEGMKRSLDNAILLYCVNRYILFF